MILPIATTEAAPSKINKGHITSVDASLRFKCIVCDFFLMYMLLLMLQWSECLLDARHKHVRRYIFQTNNASLSNLSEPYNQHSNGEMQRAKEAKVLARNSSQQIMTDLASENNYNSTQLYS